ncbi:hypothetical protein Tco_0819277 [Tanacetum coccineum]|uniref:Uncharacterized protein n=1 Tax=Tanacetum coccineum TaxID=301880 RepID=A0ABQ5AA15_9ASTR
MSGNDNFSLHDDEELSLHDDASLDGSVPASNKGDAPAKPPQIITTNTLSNIKLPVLQKDTQANRGKKRPRESNASFSSTTQNHPSSSLSLDAIVDENDDDTFHSNSSSSPSQNVSSSSNVVPRVTQNAPYESHYLNTHLSETINLQTQQRDVHREGLRSIGQALKNMMVGRK